ncbi:hypothetical protein Trydic_g16297 [Trypoxylus dichotomus]
MTIFNATLCLALSVRAEICGDNPCFETKEGPSPPIPEGYRPISLLSTISKVLDGSSGQTYANTSDKNRGVFQHLEPQDQFEEDASD